MGGEEVAHLEGGVLKDWGFEDMAELARGKVITATKSP